MWADLRLMGAPSADLNVCHVIQYFAIGGIERMVLSLAQAARAFGVRSTVVAYVEDGPYRQVFHSAGVPTCFFPTEPGVQVRLIGRLARFVSDCAFDVVHTHHLGPFMYGGVAAALAGARLVHTEHSRELYDKGRRRMIGRAMQHCSRLVVVSDELAEWRERHLGARPEVVVNGVGVPQERPGLGGEGFVIGCVARLSPEKDHATLVRAFARVRDVLPTARLVLVGDGPEQIAIERLAQELEVAEAVTLLGVQADVPALMRGFHAVALASRREGLPLALLEAMASARPIVATRVGGIPELLSRGGGQVVAPGDPDAMARALLVYGRDFERARADGRAGRGRVQAQYSEDTMVSRYVAIYRDVCREPRRRSGGAG